jgi:hypothetical protein
LFDVANNPVQDKPAEEATTAAIPNEKVNGNVENKPDPPQNDIENKKEDNLVVSEVTNTEKSEQVASEENINIGSTNSEEKETLEVKKEPLKVDHDDDDDVVVSRKPSTQPNGDANAEESNSKNDNENG